MIKVKPFMKNKRKNPNGSVTIRKYSVFTGCLIPSRYPSIEIASRKVLEKLDIDLFELRDTTCCPNQMAIKSTDDVLWETMAARNLAIGDMKGFDILTLCNGCYNTLKTVNSALKNNDELKERVNKELSKVDLEFKGILKVKHILEVLHDDIGSTEIEKLIVRNIDDLKVAVHYGCHIVRPEDNMGFDDPAHPVKLDNMVELLGARSIDYPEKYECCGGGLKIASTENAVSFARNKLNHMRDSGADCIVVVCPYCRAQLESSIIEMEDTYNEKFELPIFYYTELLGLAMGFNPEELLLTLPDVNFEAKQKLISKITGKITKPSELFDDIVTKDQLQICSDCLACADDCSTAMVTDYRPDEIIKLALEGKLNEILARDDIWYCMNCHECIEQCPQGFGMVKLIFRLKNLAIDRGICPEVIINRDTELADSGFAFKPNDELRKKLGLPKIKCVDSGELSELLSGTGVEKIKKDRDKNEK
jgi:heterodisulfide reductase subunit B